MNINILDSKDTYQLQNRRGYVKYAWEKIKNRKGETKNGTFIKENLPERCIVNNKDHCFMAHKCKECEFTTV